MSVDIGEDRGYIEALDSVDVRELLPAMQPGELELQRDYSHHRGGAVLKLNIPAAGL